jgi:hypothetical protein
MNAFGAFVEPDVGPSIILYNDFNRSIYLIQAYQSLNIRLHTPYLTVNATQNQTAGSNETFEIKATSFADNDLTASCSVTLQLFYINNNDPSIFKTGLGGLSQLSVDSPDEMSIDLQYEFFGRNMSYHVNLSEGDKMPQWYV